MGQNMRKPVSGGSRTTKVQISLGRLVSTFVIRFLESIIISKLATGEISIFLLVSVAEETDLILAWSETPKTGFVVSRSI